MKVGKLAARLNHRYVLPRGNVLGAVRLIKCTGIVIAYAFMGYIPMHIMGRLNRRIIFHEVQYLRKGETYATAYNSCNKKEAHGGYINVSDIPQSKCIDRCSDDYKSELNVNDINPINNAEVYVEPCK